MGKVSTGRILWNKYGHLVLLAIVILLTFRIGFYFGEIKSLNDTKVNIITNNSLNNNPTQEKVQLAMEALDRQGVDLEIDQGDIEIPREDCLFVASRKSHKYHTWDCRYGKNIKAENRVCFKSRSEAEEGGYVPAKGCLGDK